MKKIILHIVLLLAMLLPQAARGAECNALFYLNTADGLSSNYIRSMGQDARGYVWVATETGLSRFDGSRFTSFYKENSGLSSNELNWVMADPSHSDWVWIATQRNGLCRYDYATDCFSWMNDSLQLGSWDIVHLAPSSKGDGIWITAYHQGVEFLHTATGRLHSYRTQNAQGEALRNWCCAEDAAGRYLYVGHVDAGMSRIDLATGQVTTYHTRSSDPQAIPSNQVFALCIDKDGLVWLGTDCGAAVFDPDSERFLSFAHQPGNARSILPGDVRSIIQLTNGELWFASSQGGVSILPPRVLHWGEDARFTRLTPAEDGLSEAFVRQLMQDSYGNVWMGTYCKGLNVRSYHPSMFAQLNDMTRWGSGAGNEPVWSLAFDSRGQLWMGGTDELVCRDAEGKVVHRWTNGEGVLYDVTRTLAVDEHDNVWLGTSHTGLHIYQTATGKHLDPPLPVKDVYYIYPEPKSRVWIGTHDGMYSSIDGGRTLQEETGINRQLTDHIITAILRDADGNLWVGTFGNGVFIFTPDGEMKRNLSVNSNLPGAAVNALYMDRAHRIWVGTRTGLKVYDRLSVSDHARSYGTDEGLESLNVHAFAEDEDGNMWFSTSGGLGCIAGTDGAVSFYEYAGKQPFEAFNNGAAASDASGRIYFGSLSGVTAFYPRRILEAEAHSDLKITAMKVYVRGSSNAEDVLDLPVGNDRIELTYRQNTFAITYNILDITQSANAELAYNMQGLDDLWTSSDADHVAIFRNLNPGYYRFRVRMRVNGQSWSEPMVLLEVVIRKPWYATGWFIGLSLLTLLALAALIAWFYYRRLKAEQQLILEEEQSKNRERLHEERLRFFTNVTHELRTPLSMILGPLEDLASDPAIPAASQGKLHLMRSNSMRLLNLINTILDFRKTETQNRKLAVVEDNFTNYVREIAIGFRELNRKSGVRIDIDIPEEHPLVMYYDPETVTTVLNNLVGNALKYTPEGVITIAVRPVSEQGVNYVDLSVSDTGVGMSADALSHIFDRYYQGENSRHVNGTGIGLALTKNLVDLHQGTIRVESEEGKGSVFTVRLLRDNLYPDAIHPEPEATLAAAEESTPSAGVPAQETGAVMLVVDDDADVRAYVGQSFEDRFQILSAAHGQEGLELARKHLPDVIVSDIMMPVMDGIEMCRRLKADPSTSHIPIILLTAKDSIQDKEVGYDVGADSYLTKPFSAKLLRARIYNMMEARHRMVIRLLALRPAARKAAAQPDAAEPAGMQAAAVSDEAHILTEFDRELLEKMQQLISDHLSAEDLDMAWLADHLCMSQSTLYRKIKSITGVKPNEFVKKLKLNKAASLLLEGNVALSDIPFLTGFSSMAYFRKVFKAEFGVTPSEYITDNKPLKP